MSRLEATTIAFGMAALVALGGLWVSLVATTGVILVVSLGTVARRSPLSLGPSRVAFVCAVHWMVVAPIGMVVLDHWPLRMDGREGRHDALAAWSWSTLLGSVLLLYGLHLGRYAGRARPVIAYRFRRQGVLLIACAALACLVIQLVFILTVGGVAGYGRLINTRGAGSFAGLGLLFAVSESGTVLAAVAYYARIAQRRSAGRPVQVLRPWLLTLMFSILVVFSGGLRGSRTNLIWPALICIGLHVVTVRALRKKTIVIGVATVTLMLYLYGFYKSTGTDFVDTVSTSDFATLESETGRTIGGLVLGDLARVDVQAYLFYRGLRPWGVGGETYIAASRVLVPGPAEGLNARSKVEVGTDLRFGTGSYERGSLSRRIYGAPGEAMLNFGWIGFVGAFGAWGWVVGRAEAVSTRLFTSERRLLIPFIVLTTIASFHVDMDNLIFLLLKNAGIPIVVLLLATRRVSSHVGDVARPTSTDRTAAIRR